MIYYEDRCCDCAVPGYPCGFCGLRRVKTIECDRCGTEADRLFEVKGKQVCLDCALKMLPHNRDEDTYNVDGVWVNWDEVEDYLEEVDTYNV